MRVILISFDEFFKYCCVGNLKNVQFLMHPNLIKIYETVFLEQNLQIVNVKNISTILS